MRSSKLWAWFELSYASWLTIPRVLLHEMPVEWQDKLADLLKEYDATFPNQPDIGTCVMFTKSGRFTRGPKWLLNYRRPDKKRIEEMRGGKVLR